MARSPNVTNELRVGDLMTFLAVRRSGSVSGAARELAEETGWDDIVLLGEIYRWTHAMEYDDVIVRQVERFFLARTELPEREIIGVEAMHAADRIATWRWWTLTELDATAEAIWPAELPGLIRKTLT